MSITQYMDITDSVMWETVKNTNYNSHNTSRQFTPIAFQYAPLTELSPEAYIYPYGDTFNPFIMIEGSPQSFTSFVYKLISPESFHPSMLLTPNPEANVMPMSMYDAMQQYFCAHPSFEPSVEHDYGIVINQSA